MLQRVKQKFSLHRIDFGHHHTDEPMNVKIHGHRIRLLSFNIQAGLNTTAYSEYFTKSWRQVVPKMANYDHLNNIGHMLREFDVVALQEVDGGSIRSGFVNQLDYLATQGDFAYQYQQLNRNFGRFGQFSNGLLSKWVPYSVESHRLPGWKGRGAIIARFGNPEHPLVLVGLHLALGEKGRFRQLEYVVKLIESYEHVIIMGDLNCPAEALIDTPLRDISLRQTSSQLNTFPSWDPKKNLDHILVSSSLTIDKVEVLPYELSDHRPIAMEVRLPDSVVEKSLSFKH